MQFYKHYLENFTKKTKMSELPYVYIVSVSDFKYIKIGMTKSIKQRLVNLQSGCPFKMFLWTAIRTPIPKEIEKYLHTRMNHCLFNGEWFSPKDLDLDYLQSFSAKTNENVRSIINALL